MTYSISFFPGSPACRFQSANFLNSLPSPLPFPPFLSPSDPLRSGFWVFFWQNLKEYTPHSEASIFPVEWGPAAHFSFLLEPSGHCAHLAAFSAASTPAPGLMCCHSGPPHIPEAFLEHMSGEGDFSFGSRNGSTAPVFQLTPMPAGNLGGTRAEAQGGAHAGNQATSGALLQCLPNTGPA